MEQVVQKVFKVEQQKTSNKLSRQDYNEYFHEVEKHWGQFNQTVVNEMNEEITELQRKIIFLQQKVDQKDVQMYKHCEE